MKHFSHAKTKVNRKCESPFYMFGAVSAVTATAQFPSDFTQLCSKKTPCLSFGNSKKVQRKAQSECYVSHSPTSVPRWLFQESTARKPPESYDNFWWTAEWFLSGKHCWSSWQTTCYSLELITTLPYSQRDTCPTFVGHRSVVDEGGGEGGTQ